MIANIRIPFLFLLILFYENCLADSTWVRVKLNDMATIEFPLIPELLDGEDEVMMACADSFGNYFSAVIGSLRQSENRDTGISGLRTMYKGLAERKIASDNGATARVTDIEMLGVPGIDLFYTKSDSAGHVLGKFVRMWFKKDRIYSFEVWYNPSSAPDVKKQKDRFFNSFRYTEKRPFEMDAIMTMIRKSFTALIIGFMGILVMTFFMIRRRSKRKAQLTI